MADGTVVEVVEDDEALTQVGRFLDPSEAQMALGMLQAAGIEGVLQGENANAIVPMAFRVRLAVRHEDADAARALLADTALEDAGDDGE